MHLSTGDVVRSLTGAQNPTGHRSKAELRLVFEVKDHHERSIQ